MEAPLALKEMQSVSQIKYWTRLLVFHFKLMPLERDINKSLYEGTVPKHWNK